MNIYSINYFSINCYFILQMKIFQRIYSQCFLETVTVYNNNFSIVNILKREKKRNLLTPHIIRIVIVM